MDSNDSVSALTVQQQLFVVLGLWDIVALQNIQRWHQGAWHSGTVGELQGEEEN